MVYLSFAHKYVLKQQNMLVEAIHPIHSLDIFFS
jgi:hypothetical protein